MQIGVYFRENEAVGSKILGNTIANSFIQATEHNCTTFEAVLVDLKQLESSENMDLLEHCCADGIPVIVVEADYKKANAQHIMKCTPFAYISLNALLETTNFEEWVHTETYRQQHALRVKEQHKEDHKIFEELIDPVCVFSKSLNVLEANRAFLNFFEVDSIEELNGLNALIDFSFEEMDAQLGNNGTIRNIQVNATKNEWTIPCLCSIWSVENQSLKNKFFLALHDISDRQVAEEQAKRAEKLAMISRLTRSLGHEVRNPLNNILLSLSTLKEECDEEHQLYVDIIERNADRINELITELLNSSKQASLELSAVSIRSIITGLLQLSGDRFRLRKVRLVQDLKCSNVLIKADKEKLQIALLNILINAIEAIDHDNGRVVVSCHETSDGRYAQFTIEDNGKGMTEEEQRVLFDPFYSKKKRGIGLGLTTSQNIINAHSGSVTVSSIQGEGTVFTIAIPLAKNHMN